MGRMNLTVGPHLITLSTFLQLSPKWFVCCSLLVAEKNDQEWIYRQAVATALMVSLSLEMFWTGFHPKPFSPRIVSLCLFASTTAIVLACVLAFEIPNYFNNWSATLLLASAGVLAVPMNQLCAVWRIKQKESTARFRIMGWILSVCVATLPLVVSAAASTIVVCTLVSVYPFFVAWKLSKEQTNALSTSIQAENQSNKQEEFDGSGSVPISAAVLFVFFSCAVGTNAEAVNDMAISMRVRDSLSKGSKTLAVTNNLSVLASQVLAFVSETGFGQGSTARRNLLFCGLWCSCQILRASCMHLIQGSDRLAQQLVGGFVFFDKYTGSLGQAALDIAGLELLRSSMQWESSLGFGIPAPFLVSLRMASFKYERPLWDLLLLREAEWPITLPTLVYSFTTIFLAFVVHQLVNLDRQDRAKEKLA